MISILFTCLQIWTYLMISCYVMYFFINKRKQEESMEQKMKKANLMVQSMFKPMFAQLTKSSPINQNNN